MPIVKPARLLGRNSAGAGVELVGEAYWKIAEWPYRPVCAAASNGFAALVVSQTNTTRLPTTPLARLSSVRVPPNHEPAVAEVEVLKEEEPPDAAINWLRSVTVEAA